MVLLSRMGNYYMNIPNPPNLAKFNLRGVPMLSWGTHFA